MRTLLVLRHAKSSWNDSSLSDHERPLNKRGRLAAKQMGEFMRAQELLPDHVLASSAKRVQETLTRWADSSGYQGPIETHKALYLAEPATYIEHLKKLREPEPQRVMCVGHNPGLEMLVAQVTGVTTSMPTAALAHIEFSIDSWQELDEQIDGRLVNVHRVKEL